jgi:hypothetical protein
VSVSNGFSRLNPAPIKVYLREPGVNENRTLLFKINHTIIEDIFQDGEILLIEMYLNDELYQERNKIFETILSGEVTSWIGAHSPVINELSKQNLSVGVWLTVSESKSNS